ncbi:hypothetical protein DL98DRAFT_572555 [Cadophora sp. DSE1049]|nr:hypothetical protein DL98DRAFT_572555 [Cadophora sp. DSE1049]
MARLASTAAAAMPLRDSVDDTSARSSHPDPISANSTTTTLNVNVDTHVRILSNNKTDIFLRYPHNDSGVSLSFDAGLETENNNKSKSTMADLDPSTPVPMPSTPNPMTSTSSSPNPTTSTQSSPISSTATATAPAVTAPTAPAASTLPSAPASTLQSAPAIPVQGFVPSNEQKRIYRFRGADLIATNNTYAFPDPIIDPRTRYPTQRVTDVCDNEEFAQCWKEHLSVPIVQYLANVVESWTLNVLRSGFANAEDPSSTPIVVHLSTGLLSTDRPVTEKLSLDIILVVSSIISRHWQGESIYIDVCKIQRSLTFSRSTSFDGLSDIPSRYYVRNPPFPGCSIGTKDEAGTLTGYIKHKDEFYKYTCRHVGGPPGTLIYSPALSDHDVIKEALEKFVPSLRSRSMLGGLHARLLAFLSGPFNFISYWRKTLKASLAWNPDCGTVTSSSSSEQMLVSGGYDWCLTKFQGKPGKNYNRHVPFHQFDLSSGFQFHAVPYFSSSDITTAESYFDSGPSFKPIRSTPLKALEVCPKPPSRTIDRWTVGRVNTINMVKQQSSTAVPYEDYCIISTSTKMTAAFSAKGDSGSVILDKDFQPVAVVQDGINATAVSQDITGAVHLSSILSDMEKVNGWKEGSVVFCSGGD